MARIIIVMLIALSNPQLQESKKTDLGKAFLKIENPFDADKVQYLDSIKTSDLSRFLLSSEHISENGIIGSKYRRIQVHIHSVSKDKNNPLKYHIKGKSKVVNNITIFSGIIKFVDAVKIKAAEAEDSHTVIAAGKYKFSEPTDLAHSGVFEGTLKLQLYYNFKDKKLSLAPDLGQDGYSNRTFAGTWQDYKTKNILKCIWGLGRLPFTDDFDIGTGEMYINKKYEHMGWKSFNERTDYYYNQELESFIEKNNWWLEQK